MCGVGGGPGDDEGFGADGEFFGEVLPEEGAHAAGKGVDLVLPLLWSVSAYWRLRPDVSCRVEARKTKKEKERGEGVGVDREHTNARGQFCESCVRLPLTRIPMNPRGHLCLAWV